MKSIDSRFSCILIEIDLYQQDSDINGNLIFGKNSIGILQRFCCLKEKWRRHIFIYLELQKILQVLSIFAPTWLENPGSPPRNDKRFLKRARPVQLHLCNLISDYRIDNCAFCFGYVKGRLFK